jgi:hypothetical protein
MRYVLFALAVLFVSPAAAEDALNLEPIYVGAPTRDRHIAACLDAATAQRVLVEQQERGADSAQKMFVATGVCFVMQADFVALRLVAEVDMGTHKVRIVEVGSLTSPDAPHLFVLTESPLLDGITA